MQAPITTNTTWISASFLEAVQNPLQEGISGKLLERSFEHLPEEKRQSLIQNNLWALLARRVAGHLSNLAPNKFATGRAFDCYGNVVNVAAHVLTAAMLKQLDVPHAKEYIDRVEKVQSEVLRKINEKGASELKSLNFSRELNYVDVPENEFGKPLSLGTVTEREELAAILETRFYTEIVKRNETKSGTSLRASADDAVKDRLMQMIKRMLVDSEFITSFEKLKTVQEASCMILEGKELYDYIERETNNHRFDEKTSQNLAGKTVAELRQAAEGIVVRGVFERLEKFVQENPTFPLTAEEIAAYFIQDFYPRVMGVKIVVDKAPIQRAREFVCPGIREIQFPRIAILGVVNENVAPLAPLAKEKVTLTDVFKIVSRETGDSRMLDILKAEAYRMKTQSVAKSAAV